LVVAKERLWKIEVVVGRWGRMLRVAVAKREVWRYERVKVMRIARERRVIVVDEEMPGCSIGGGYPLKLYRIPCR
jgi:hypothetical protein